METTKVKTKLDKIMDSVDTKGFLCMSMVEWRPLLAKECQVYVHDESYIAKRFDQINYKFCTKDTAKEILVDNLYALLRYKYFKVSNEEVEDKIVAIIKSFTTNLKTSLIRVSFNDDEDCKSVAWLPNGCIAFRNGVYDFKNDKWLFRYDVIKIETLQNVLYMYDPNYIITWYLNINFEPMGINIMDTSLEDFIEIMKDLDSESRNYCFELMYNMAFDYNDVFDLGRFKHLCEILGYLCYQSFTQKFVLFVGAGQNGKNSLLDGCFVNRIVPKPAAIDLISIEKDRFVTGALENKAHNIYLETSTNDDAYKDNTHLKALTGSQDQSIEAKGENKYSGIINCKHIWSANDQEKIKFSDTTTGFRRRINIFEIYYQWDKQKRFMQKGNYYDTTFSEDLHEIKKDLNNIIVFLYFAMYGIKEATENFTRSFSFTKNDWKLTYTDIDFILKDVIGNISAAQIYNWISKIENFELGKTLMYDLKHNRLHDSESLKELGYTNYEDLSRFLKNENDFIGYFVDHEIYISIHHIQRLIGNVDSVSAFTQKFKKAFGVSKTTALNNNRPYVKAKFVNGKLKIIGG